MQLQHQEIEDETSSTRSVPYTDRKPTEAGPERSETLRVTPEEVALAVAALEAKRENDSAHREATLPLEEAIQHLGLNATPEELASEVVSLRAERDTKAQQEGLQALLRHKTRVGKTIALAALLVFISVVVGALSFSLWQSRRALRNALHPMAALPIQKLSSIPDNTPVHIDSDTLAALAKGTVTPENVSVDTRTEDSGGNQSATMFNNEWTLVKSDGMIQVRGWATAELALNISNDATGGIFSSRPGWLPANNLVPIQVPVYRLYKQETARYLPDGKIANSAGDSVLMVENVASIGTAAQDFIEKDIVNSNENFAALSYEGYSHVDVSSKDNIVHLTGNATTDQLKKQAGDVAVATLKRLHIPYTVSNELKIATNNE